MIANRMTKDEALEKILSVWTPNLEAETIPLTQAAGRVTAAEVHAKFDLPPVRASQMDGVAVKSERFRDGMPDTSNWRLGRDFVRADTGDDFPDDFDAVIAIEDVELTADGGIRILKDLDVHPGFTVKPAGADVKAGSVICSKGRKLTARDLAAVAMGGYDSVSVLRRPRVGFIPTGSELIPIGSELKRGQNFDTNSLMVTELLREMGAEPMLHDIVRDDPEVLLTAMQEMLPTVDLLLVNAGTSKGGEDFNVHILAEQGESLFRGVAAVPGRPMSAAMMEGKPVINLSGPAFAAFYSVDWMVRPLVCRALGIPVPERQKVWAVLTQDLHTPPIFSMMAGIRLAPAEEGSAAPYIATPLANRGPGAVGAAVSLCCDAVYISTPGEKPRMAGDVVEVELLRNPAEIG